jgi:hypothetical protein
MPSEHAQSPSARRAELGDHRSTSSIHSQTESPSTTPPHHNSKSKAHKHVVGRTYARVPSTKSLHKSTKAHGNEGSHTDLKKLNRNSSATSLKKNSSHASLKRNRSSADISKRPKSSHGQEKRPTSVHFEIGDQDDGGWEEASSSASPALSRSASRLSSHQSSAKPSANNSQPNSPVHSPSSKAPTTSADGGSDRQSARPTSDAKIITERLLQRTPSHNTTKMSLATATPTVGNNRSPDSMGKSHSSTFNGTPKTGSKEDMVSRFVGGSGTPNESSPFLKNRKEAPKHAVDEVKKSKSMGNLSRPEQHRDEDDDDTESALAPRSRKSSTGHAYVPPQQSRTQQKLWLQRASSNIEPQQMAPGAAINGLSAIQGGLGGLVGTGYDGRDPRIKIQLERTGLEYLVVRRHQDPVGQALKRLSQLPGADKNRQIAAHSPKKSDGGGAGAYGLSQSLKESRRFGKDKTGGGRSSYDGGSQDDAGLSRRTNDEEDGVGSILRSIWEKNYDLSTSAD